MEHERIQGVFQERQKLEPKAHLFYQEILENRIIGQPEATEAFAKLAVRIKSGIRAPSGIIDSKFLAGPSGVGKTELTLTLARLFDTESGNPKEIKIDCGLLQQPHEMSKLVGSPPGYVGSKGTGSYVEPLLSPENIQRNTINYKDAKGDSKKLVIILFDEFEKAHPDVQRLLLVSLDKGTIETATNTKVNLSNSVILFTSNIGNQKVEQLKDAHHFGFGPETKNQNKDRETVISEMKNAFPPEFRGRVNDVIIFNHLDKDSLENIVKIKIDEVVDIFENNDLNIKLDPTEKLINYLVENGYNQSEGARAVIKLINEKITNNLIATHSDYNINNSKIIVDIDEKEEPTFYFGEKLPNIENQNIESEIYQNKEEQGKNINEYSEFELPAKSIEEVRYELLRKLNEENEVNLKNLDSNTPESPIFRLLNNIEYIYNLSDKIPELNEYITRRGSPLIITPSLFSITPRLLSVNSIDNETNYNSLWYKFSLYDSGNIINLNLNNKPNMQQVLSRITSIWDRGETNGIKKFANLSKYDIVKALKKLKTNY